MSEGCAQTQTANHFSHCVTEGGTEDRSRPSLVLEGPARVEIVQGDTYTRCSPAQLETGKPCDRGARAVDSVQGDLASSIEVTCFFESIRGVKVGQEGVMQLLGVGLFSVSAIECHLLPFGTGIG
eukprot:1155815-Pelagomonas_calceolata.AAC.4